METTTKPLIEPEITSIRTDNTTKQFVRYQLASFLATIEGFDCWEHLRKATILLLGIKDHRAAIYAYLVKIYGVKNAEKFLHDA